ncbi:MAG: ABC transporter [Opitutaceae bacterium]|nr:ABC transporter [Opitutaceae bacterium]|tara:strand:- start:266 stop:1525 length:1260 start_codon:yes stop_codon:yes gene_type:complete
MRRIISELVESIRIAVEQVNAHKTRSCLTVLGVIIGVLAVTLMGTAMNGIDKGVNDSLEIIGNDVFYVERYPWDASSEDYRNMKNRPYIRDIEAERLNEIIAQTNGSNLYRAAPAVFWYPPAEFKTPDKAITNVQALGTDENFELIAEAAVVDGRSFTEIEAEAARAVVVLGADVAEALFPDESAVGKTVRAKGHELEVVGVFARQGSFFGLMSFDNFALVPIKWLRKHYIWNWTTNLRVRIAPGADKEEARYELIGAMRRVHGQIAEDDDNFSVNSTDAIEDNLASVKNGLAIGGFGITGLSLFVGAIGIMNITFVSVKERTREIGTRRAMGARRSSILLQFLTEAVSVCLVGGAFGLGIAWGLKLAIDKAFSTFPFVFSANLVVIAMVASIIVGVLSGFIPALVASRLDPATALRHE